MAQSNDLVAGSWAFVAPLLASGRRTRTLPVMNARLTKPELVLDDLAFSGGCATGWVDLSATASQGPALVVMLVTFALTLPGRAPVTLVSLVTARPAGRSHGEYCVVPVDEIEWIQGDTYCVRVHAGGRERLYRERLSRLELRLEPEQFHRTHRSALVRLDLIRELCAESRYSYSALLSTARECR